MKNGFFKDMWKKVDNLEETIGVKAINRKMDEFFKKVEESLKKLKARFSVTVFFASKKSLLKF